LIDLKLTLSEIKPCQQYCCSFQGWRLKFTHMVLNSHYTSLTFTIHTNGSNCSFHDNELFQYQTHGLQVQHGISTQFTKCSTCSVATL